MRAYKSLIAAVSILFLMLSGQTRAETLYFGYEGEILFFDNPESVDIGCNPEQATRLKGCYAVQSDAVDHNSNPEQGKYYPDVSWVEFGDCHFGSENGAFNNILIFATNYPNGPYIDDNHQVVVESFNAPSPDLEWWSAGFSLVAHNPSDLVLSEELPDSPPDPNLAFHREFNWHGGTSFGFDPHLVGWIDTYYRATSACEELSVPEVSCVGFEPPMANYPVKVKKNRALPLKAEVFEYSGAALSDLDLAAPPVVQVLYDSGAGGDPIDVTEDVLSAGQGSEGNQFVFNDEGYWQFNLKTNNYSAPGTYIVQMESGNGSEYVFSPTCETEFIVD
jgi:hypothetical protein